MRTLTMSSPRPSLARPAIFRPGLTLLDLIVCLAIVGLLAAVAFSADGPLVRARESACRVKCASNLKMIGQSMMLYGNDNKGNFPRAVYKVGEAPTQYTGVETKDPFGKDSTIKPNDVTAALFLLIRTQDVPADVFICPSTDRTAARIADPQAAGNFKSEEQLTYSVANPYPSKIADDAGFRWNMTTLNAGFATAADMNPGTVDGGDPSAAKGPKDANAPAADLQKANSLNHFRAGQNVLYGDGHIEFQQTPFAGVKRDNIYTASPSDDKTTSDVTAGAPGYAGDSVLLPVATASPHTQTPAQREAAALKQGKEMLERGRKQIAAMEAREGQTDRVREGKGQLDMLEKMIAETEKNQGK